MSELSPAGATEDIGSPDEQGSRHIYVVFSGLVLVMLLAALDSTIVSTALPTIVGELGGFDHISWVVHLARAGTAAFGQPLGPTF